MFNMAKHSDASANISSLNCREHTWGRAGFLRRRLRRWVAETRVEQESQSRSHRAGCLRPSPRCPFSAIPFPSSPSTFPSRTVINSCWVVLLLSVSVLVSPPKLGATVSGAHGPTAWLWCALLMLLVVICGDGTARLAVWGEPFPGPVSAPLHSRKQHSLWWSQICQTNGKKMLFAENR